MNPHSRSTKIVILVLGIVIVLSLVLSMVGCSSDSSDAPNDDSPDRGAALDRIGTEVIVPAQQELASSAAALSEALDQLCETPDGDTLQSARRQWDLTQGAWQRTEAFRFGPIRTLHSAARISYPLNQEKLDALLADPAALGAAQTPEAVAELGADVRGLAGIEHVLFTPADAGELTSSACAFASSAAVDVASTAGELATAWTEGVDGEAAFIDEFTEPGEDSSFDDEQEIIDQLVNASLAAMTNIAETTLGPASGATTEAPEPAVVDSGAAHRALRDTEDILAGVDAVYDGLSGIVAGLSEPADTTMRDDLSDTADAVAAVPAPMSAITADDVASIDLLRAAYDAAVATRVTLRTEVASLLGVTIGFSDADGDA